MAHKLIKQLLLNKWSSFLHDLLWIPLALFLSYLLRFNFDGIPPDYRASLIQITIVSVPAQGILYWVFGLYRGMWRFASIPDLIRILKAVFLGSLLVALLAALVTRLAGVPLSVFFLYPVLLTAGLSLPRLFYRWFKDNNFSLSKNAGKRVVIIGAGNAGALLLRDLTQREEYLPIGFIDDDTTKHGREIHGVKVLGSMNELDWIVRAFAVEEIIIAIPSASKEEMQRISAGCGAVGIVTCILPSLRELTDMQVNSSQLRPLTIEDLLGRKPVRLKIEDIKGYLQGKVVLVTGGGGSIGTELCRQVAEMKPDLLIILEHSEFNLYSIEQELLSMFSWLKFVPVLGDVKNYDRVDWVFREFQPNVVFHAAAYKHVPMVEMNPAEGVCNNVIGTQMVADAADRYGVGRFVQVSTDKAVNPANIMGTTKRIGELYCQNLDARSNTRFITTRFGNVLGSAGSVVPLFQRQIEKGGPVTVTHPEITRYFMTIPEAVGLILQAGAMGQGGEIFVLDMGEPVLIKDLAEQMIRLSGLESGKDIEIIFTGLRPGEKLFEEILHDSERLQPTNHEKLFLARSREVDWDWLIDKMARLRQAALSRDLLELRTCLQDIVPEFKGAGQGLTQPTDSIGS